MEVTPMTLVFVFRLDPFLRAGLRSPFDLRTFALHPAAAVSDRGIFYNGLTISGYRMATPGMRAMDLEMRLTDGGALPRELRDIRI
jgi:hypothetical protein